MDPICFILPDLQWFHKYVMSFQFSDR